jgi:hypothetical protein
MEDRTFEGVRYVRLRESLASLSLRGFDRVFGNLSRKAANDTSVELYQDDAHIDASVMREAELDSSQEDRERVEKSLLRKLDTRMSILVLIYILNYVSSSNPGSVCAFSTNHAHSIGCPMT